MLHVKQVYIAHEEVCYSFNGDEWCEVQELRRNQAEADTRMLLHVNHARSNGTENIGIHTPETDVFIIMMFFLNSTRSFYMKTRAKGKVRIIDLEALKKACKKSPQNTGVDEVFNALPGLHIFTECDTVSALAGKGKVKAIKLIKKNNEFLRLFQVIGNKWTLPKEVYSQAERFICHFYGPGEENVNLLHYKIYCARRGKIEGQQLPPCCSSLRKHVHRANYQSRIWKLPLQSVIEAPSPTLHGLKQAEDDDDEELRIDWMDCLPAPENVSFSKIFVTKGNQVT